jgi:hypothetical protein
LFLVNDLGLRIVPLPASGSVVSRNTLIARIEKYGLARPLTPRRAS